VAGEQPDHVGQVRGVLIEHPVQAAGLRVVFGNRGHKFREMIHGHHGHERTSGSWQRRKPPRPQVADQFGRTDVLTGLARSRVADHAARIHHGQRDPQLRCDDPYGRVPLGLGAFVSPFASVELHQFGLRERIPRLRAQPDPVARHVDQPAQAGPGCGPAQHVKGALDVDRPGLLAPQPEPVDGGGVENIPYPCKSLIVCRAQPQARTAREITGHDREPLGGHAMIL
jgi:hypothetical protein